MLKAEKPKEVEELRQLMNTHTVVGLLTMHKLPARQLQKIKSELRGTVQIRMSKKSLMTRAMDGSGAKNIAVLRERLGSAPALILSNENPFRLFRTIKENRASAPAKAGDIALHDIVILKGPTPLPPGPAISTLQKVGLKTSVQQGKIAVLQDKIVVKAGEAVSADAANVLNLLKMEPMEIGIELVALLEGGVLYGKDVLDVDVEAVMQGVTAAVQEALNLSVESGFPTSESIDLMVTNAFNEAKSIAQECGIADKDFIEDVMVKAIREAEEMKKTLGIQ